MLQTGGAAFPDGLAEVPVPPIAQPLAIDQAGFLSVFEHTLNIFIYYLIDD